jgi:hypothetical protein
MAYSDDEDHMNNEHFTNAESNPSLAQKYHTSGNKNLKKSFEDSYFTVRDENFNRRLSELD